MRVRPYPSVRQEAPSGSEVVVVDGSDQPLGADCIRSMIADDSLKLTYMSDEPKGVYNGICRA